MGPYRLYSHVLSHVESVHQETQSVQFVITITSKTQGVFLVTRIIRIISKDIVDSMIRVIENIVKLESRLPRGRNMTISIIDSDSKIW